MIRCDNPECDNREYDEYAIVGKVGYDKDNNTIWHEEYAKPEHYCHEYKCRDCQKIQGANHTAIILLKIA